MNVVYRVFSKENELLYIGVTKDLKHRISNHKSSKNWWHEVSRIDEECFDDRISAMKAELNAIKNECPKYNKLIRQDESRVGNAYCSTIRIESELRDRIAKIATREHRTFSAQALFMLHCAVQKEEEHN
jgi:excinuclease UvrABC nuclease subunit